MAYADFKNGVTFSALSASTVAFTLAGGAYALGLNATWGGGNAVLQILMPDGSTYISCATALTADGFQVLDLPAGTYKFVITTATAVQGFLLPIPYRPS